jgi:drug/metabolite transporter (DMT)-like permease
MGVLLAILAGLSWAGLDATRKRLTEAVSPLALAFLLAVTPVPAFLAWASWDGGWWSSVAYWPPGLGAALCSAIAYVAFLRAVQLSPLSLTIPLLSLTPVLTLLLGAIVNQEVPAPRQDVGIVLVVGGAILLHSHEGNSIVSSVRQEPGARYMVLVALLWSLSGTLDKRALGHAAVAAHALTQTVGVSIITLGVLTARGKLRSLGDVSKAPRAFALAVVLSIAALGLQLSAMSRIYVAYVETVKRGLGVVMALVFGRLLFDEAVTPRKVGGVAVIAIGTALLLLGRA